MDDKEGEQSSGASACAVDIAAAQMTSSRVESEAAPTAGTDSYGSSSVSFKTPYLPNKSITLGINKDAGFKKPRSKTDSVHVFNKPVIVREQSESDVVSQDSTDSGAKLPTAVNISPVIAAPENPRSTVSPVYTPPDWIGTPPHRYWLETLRNGVILDSLELADFSQVMFGRLPECGVTLQHPSVSRHHAVLVYRARSDESRNSGYYLYDLKSTHGTFLNKRQLLANTYCPVRVGHMFRFGGSSRLFILQGPKDDEEPEGDLSVTELRQLAVDKKLQKMEKSSDLVSLPAGTTEDDDSQGITWGMGEDACEATDLQYNPYALGEGDNQHLYLDDPKKTLRGWFEREGFDLEYITEDLTNGRHVCRIELPLNAVDGRPVFAEVNHVGRKRDAVVQCALEACRLLDRAGLLRQAKHEARGKRVRRPGLDSDDEDLDNDTFLDRTGSVEQKRQRKLLSDADKSQPQTYESLLESYTAVHDEAELLQRQLDAMQAVVSVAPAVAGDADELDDFMSSLSSRGPAALQERRRVKVKLTGLRSEELRLRKLVNLTRPATLPPLLVPLTASTPCSLQPSREAAPSTPCSLQPPREAAASPPAFKKSAIIVGKRKGGAGSLRKLPVVGGSAKSAERPADMGSRSSITVSPPQFAVECATTTTSLTSIACKSTTTSSTSTTSSSTSTTSSSASTTSSSASTTSSSASNTSSYTSTTSSSASNTSSYTSTSPSASTTSSSASNTSSYTSTTSSSASTTSSYTSTSTSDHIEPTANFDTDSATAQGCEDKLNTIPAEDADDSSQTDHPGKTSKRRRRRDRQKHVEDLTECVDSDAYSGWMPPSGQTGDGRTSLNDKLGY